jgi:hypothetical protein
LSEKCSSSISKIDCLRIIMLKIENKKTTAAR